ncbi:hypothetical protein TNCV_255271 [Trichonephila clavipes]|nr:hypothetical protein TNCV_255271 [Trichonephila clavipes]
MIIAQTIRTASDLVALPVKIIKFLQTSKLYDLRSVIGCKILQSNLSIRFSSWVLVEGCRCDLNDVEYDLLESADYILAYYFLHLVRTNASRKCIEFRKQANSQNVGLRLCLWKWISWTYVHGKSVPGVFRGVESEYLIEYPKYP